MTKLKVSGCVQSYHPDETIKNLLQQDIQQNKKIMGRKMLVIVYPEDIVRDMKGDELSEVLNNLLAYTKEYLNNDLPIMVGSALKKLERGENFFRQVDYKHVKNEQRKIWDELCFLLNKNSAEYLKIQPFDENHKVNFHDPGKSADFCAATLTLAALCRCSSLVFGGINEVGCVTDIARQISHRMWTTNLSNTIVPVCRSKKVINTITKIKLVNTKLYASLNMFDAVIDPKICCTENLNDDEPYCGRYKDLETDKIAWVCFNGDHVVDYDPDGIAQSHTFSIMELQMRLIKLRV